VDRRLPALRRFAVAITVLNVAGHTFLGFEQSWAVPLVALATAYGVELLLEMIEARLHQHRPRFYGGRMALLNFLLPAHISGLAVSMLLYSGSQLAPVALAAAVAIGSKAVFRARTGAGTRHFFNPSNLGITATLLLFPWVGIAAPYQFTEGLYGAWDWVPPAIIVCSGTFLNARFTRRIPLILSWLAAFTLQAGVRALVFGTAWNAALLPMTGMAFLLFTFYMVTDPATTPGGVRGQVLFGSAVGVAYGVLMAVHVVFGLFFALSGVCALRGCLLWVQEWARSRDAAVVSAAVKPRERALGETSGQGILAVERSALQSKSRN
jgi:Na+-translocating ferredoxin:NAD+ oxidoreductase RnfD subunit